MCQVWQVSWNVIFEHVWKNARRVRRGFLANVSTCEFNLRSISCKKTYSKFRNFIWSICQQKSRLQICNFEEKVLFDAAVETGQTLNVERVGRLIDDGTVRRSVGRTWVEENDLIYIHPERSQKIFWKWMALQIILIIK